MTSDAAFAPEPGVPFPLANGLRLILAPNPSPMTFTGTNTYLLGQSRFAVIDPGPNDTRHLRAILDATSGAISHIILTHSHVDHSSLAHLLAEQTGAPTLAFGPSHAGRSAIMQQLADDGLTGGGEGIDETFQPDITLAHGDLISTDEWELQALHTPGHIGNHLCLRWGDAMFTGDHVMGWSSSLVSPPDGDLTDFMQSCAVLQDYPSKVYYPGHGAPVMNPHDRLSWLIQHRRSREAQILEALGQQAHDIRSLTQAIYTDLAPRLLPAAERNVFAHLVDLSQRQLVQAEPQLGLGALFQLTRAERADKTLL